MDSIEYIKMTQVQVDIPKDLDEKITVFKIRNDLKTKQLAIIIALEKFFKNLKK